MITRDRFWMMLLAALAVAESPSHWREARAGVVYFATSDGYSHPVALETLDTTTGAVNVITTNLPSMIWGLQFVNGQLYGEGYGSGILYQINASTGVMTDLGTISAPWAGSGGSTYATGQNGVTYLFNQGIDDAYTLAPPSTTATQTNLPNFSSSLDYAVGPNGSIYAVTGGGSQAQSLAVMDPTTGVVTSGPALSQGVDYYSRLFFDGSSLDALSQNGLYTIDTKTGVVTQDFALSLGQVNAAAEFMPASSVPEPSSLRLCGISGAAMVLCGLWKRSRPGRRESTRRTGPGTLLTVGRGNGDLAPG